MKYRGFVRMLILGVVTVLTICGVLIYRIDPYQQYHLPLKELAYDMETNSFSYYNPGIAKNYEYDTVITGSSMSRSFQPSYVDKVFGWNTVKLSMAEARGKDFAELFEVLEKQDNWKRTIMGLDTFAFKVDKDYSSYEKPQYLYDDNIYNDLYYTLNMDGLVESVNVIMDTREGKTTTTRDDYQNYVLTNTFSSEKAMSRYDRNIIKTEEYNLQKLEQTIRDNMYQNIIPVIENNPDREFLFYFPPYSIVRWANTENIMEDFKAMELIIAHLIDYPNVSIFFYQGETEVITDLDHYMDTIHFDSVVANRIIDYMSDDRNKMMKDNYLEKLEVFQKFIQEYEYDTLLTDM